LIEAVIKIQDGFYPEVVEKHPGATYNTWLVSCLAQLMAGLLVLVTSFILTMQASTVLDLMLNLTALLFMAEIDDIGFSLAKNGFITDQLQRETESVLDFEVPKPKRRNIQRRILYLLALAGLLVCYGTLKSHQLKGKFLPTFIYVQFGDAYNPKIPYYSGILTSGNIRTYNYREYRDLGSHNILLAYCYKEQSWTFSDTNDPCDYFAKSTKTKTYDVTQIPDSLWEVKDSIDRLQPFDSFSLVSRDCNPSTCQGTCGEDGLCDCPHDRFGMDCEFTDVCQNLEIDVRFGAFPSVDIGKESFAVSHTFHLLKDPSTQEYVRVYNMPAYYSNATFPANILFYGGRRWIVTSEWDLFNLTLEEMSSSSKFFLEKTVETLQTRFHGYFQANYTPFFVSDPVDFETPTFQATPIGLGWWTVERLDEVLRYFGPDVPQSTKLLCQAETPSCIGQPEDFCNVGKGQCNNQTGLCECDHKDYFGNQCELLKPCYDQELLQCGGNGICDQSSGVCRCNLPYFGKLCERTYKCYEEDGQCKNGGICNVVTGDCECPEDPAIHGVACEQRKDCAAFGCFNGGACTWQNGVCTCRPPFYGASCEMVNTSMTEYLCSNDLDCFNGTCTVETGICACHDPASYGTLCEHQFDCRDYLDHQISCLNGGECNNYTGLCECDWYEDLGYFGPDCSQYEPCTKDSDCVQDYESSYCDVASGECVCALGIAQGPKCEMEPVCFSDDTCNENGSCNIASYTCQCVTGYGGYLCSSFLVGVYEPWRDEVQAADEQEVINCNFEPACYDP
jgi:hypothetical protein